MQNIRKVRWYDGVHTVYADPGLIVSGLSEEAADNLVSALKRVSESASATGRSVGARSGGAPSAGQSEQRASKRA